MVYAPEHEKAPQPLERPGARHQEEPLMHPKITATDRVQHQVAPGIVERHEARCAYRPGRRRCTCTPTFRARVRVGPRGSQRSITTTVATIEEARAWIAEARSGVPTAPVRVPTPQLGEAARDFLVRAKAGKALTRARRPYSPRTLDSYESALRRHVLPHIDERHAVSMEGLPIDRIDTRTMQALVNAVTAEGSASLARVADAALTAVLRDLYERGVLDTMPARPILPSPPRSREERLSIAQVDALLAAARADDERIGRSLMEPLVSVLADTGLRISEALGLTWGPRGLDLDTNPPCLSVGRETTKTDAGRRTIGLERETAAVLRRHLLATGRPEEGALVFADSKGGPLTRDGRVRAGMARVARAAGVPGGFHLLRHSHGSHLADAGQGSHVIAARLGHRDAGFTARTYVHADRERLAEAPDALSALRKRERANGAAS
jgi:integrase